MKKLLIALLFVLLLPIQVLAIEKENVISMDLLDFTRDVVSVQYERVFNPKWSFHVSPRFLIGNISGFGVLGGMRRYLDLAPEGVFFDMTTGFATASSGWVTARGFAFGGGAGYKFFPSENFAVEGCVGISYVSATASIGFFSVTASGFEGTGSLSLGYAF